MQKFSKKQIALAISASLLAGSALAAGTAATIRTNAPVLLTAFGGTTADLYATKGSKNNATIRAFLNLTNTETIDAGTDGLKVNLGTVAAPAESDIQIYLDDANKTLLAATGSFVDQTGAAPATATQAYVELAVDVTNGAANANGAFRINAGKLEYTTDNSVATPTWVAVKVAIVAAATAANRIETDTAVPSAKTPISGTAGVVGAAKDVGTALVPTPKISTRATNGLVDGLVIDSLATLGAVAASNLTLVTNATGDVSNAGTDVIAKATVAYAGTKATVKFDTPTTVDWTSGDATADAKAYASKTFNTGIAGASIPFTVGVKGGSEPTFSDVYNEATGAADVKLLAGNLPAQAAWTDGAAPVVLGAEYSPAGASNTGALKLTLSEPLTFIAGGVAATTEDVRKVLENVTLAGTKLAADFQLRSARATVAIANDIGTTNTAALTINNIGNNRTADIETKAVAVLPTIALQEAFTGNDVTLKDSAGVRSTSVTGNAANEAASGSANATLNSTVAWSDSTARAYAPAGDSTKIDNIVVDFGKALSVKAATTLDKTFKVVFQVAAATPLENGSNGDAYSFEWYPAAGEYALSGNTIKFTLPTDLLRANLRGLNDAVAQTKVYYAGGTALPLQATINAAGTKVDVASGNETVILPLTASTGAQGLYTMDVKADLKAPQGSKVVAYLAKWVEKATADAASTSVQSGKISIPGDKWATDVVLALDGATIGTLEGAIDTQLKAAKPAAVPAWVVVTRSNDLVKGGSNSGNNNENYYVASAKLYGSAAAAAAAAPAANNEATAFEVTLDPKTGNIAGRLTGNVKLKNTAGNANERGLVFIDADGALTNSAAGAAQSQALVDGSGKARFLIGAGPKKDLKDAGAVFKDAFVLLVGETQDDAGNVTRQLLTSAEPSMSNFLPFNANLVAGNDAVATLTLDVANIKTKTLAANAAWQLVGAGNLDRSAKAAAAINLPRLLVGLDGSTPTSFWTNDGDVTDMALTLLGNKSGVAVEAADKDVNTVADKANTKANAFAFAFADDTANGGKLFFLTKTAEAPALPVGWALVAANATSLPSDVSMALFAGSNHVGIGSSWATGDAAASLTVGQPVFVYAKKAIAGK